MNERGAIKYRQHDLDISKLNLKKDKGHSREEEDEEEKQDQENEEKNYHIHIDYNGLKKKILVGESDNPHDLATNYCKVNGKIILKY